MIATTANVALCLRAQSCNTGFLESGRTHPKDGNHDFEAEDEDGNSATLFRNGIS